MNIFAFVCLILLSTALGRELRQTSTFTSTFTSGAGSTANAEASASQTARGASTPSIQESQQQRTNDAVDIYLLADTNPNMDAVLSELRNNAASFIRSLFSVSGNVRIGIGQYKTASSATPFQNILSLQRNQSRLTNSVRNLQTSGGGADRTQLHALTRVASANVIGFRRDSIKIVAWIGTSPGSDPSLDATEASCIEALRNRRIRVAATDVGNLDRTGQASRITSATNGRLQKYSRGSAVSVNSEGGSASASAQTSGGSSIAAATTTGGGGTTARSATSSAASGVQLPETIVQLISSLLSR